LIEVELGDLKKLGKEFEEVLKQRLKTEITMKGTTMILRDPASGQLSMKDAKLQVEHALHHLKLSDEYRVHAEHHKIRIARIEDKKAHHVEKTGTAPSPASTMPYFFPG
jgi:hypothetical protein